MEKHVPNLMMALWALGFFSLMIALSKLVRPNRSSEVAKHPFSSGEMPEGKPWIRMAIRYQMLLTIAAIFFLGILLVYPAIATFKQWLDEGHGVLALTAVGLFLSTLGVALAYAWMNGDLNWVSDVERGSTASQQDSHQNQA